MISIIMPVYNTGKILRTTIESILAQTYDNWELLLIDDGSTDGSPQLCDDFAQKDDRIKVYHKTNGGICNARNYGLDCAKGDYIAFCDHDDLYDSKLLSTIVWYFDNYPCQAVNYKYNIITDNGKTQSYDLSGEFGDYPVRVDNMREAFCRLYKDGVIGTVWSMVYRTELLRTNNLRFDESFIYGGEDINFNLRVCQHNPTIMFAPELLYTHFVRGTLSTSAKFHPENVNLMLKHIRDFNRAAKQLNVPLAKEKINYFTVYVRLLTNSLSFAALCGLKGREYKHHCKLFRDRNLLEKHGLKTNIQDMNALQTKEKVTFLLFRMKCYVLLQMIYHLSWMLK